MKYLFFVAFLFCGAVGFSQADTIFVLGAEFGVTTAPTDSTFTVDITHPTDQLGQAFTAAKIQIDYRLIDVFGRLYRVKTVDATGIGSSTLTVVELQDSNAPSGTGLVYRKPDNSDCIPEIQTGDIGISYALAARVANHNAVNGCGGGVTSTILNDSMTVVRDSLTALRNDIGTGGGGGTVDAIVAGTGISVDATDAANPIVTNSAPDQAVSIIGAGSVAITGTYPSFTATGETVPNNWRNITGGTVSTSISDNVYRLGRITIGSSNPSYNTASINSQGAGVQAAYFNHSNTSATSVRIINYNSSTSATSVFQTETNGHSLSFGNAGANYSGIYNPGEGFLSATSGLKFHSQASDIRWTFTGAHAIGMQLTQSLKLGIGSSVTPAYTVSIGGGDAAALFTPHDGTLTGTEGLIYADNSENTFKGHNGTEFFRFMQQSTTVPTAGQIGVFNATSGLYEASNPTARSYTPTATADANGDEGDIAYDDSYIYIKTSAGWKRSALSTF